MAKFTPLPAGGNLPKKKWEFDGFNLGNNTFALATELKGSELATMSNAELFGKRSIRPRRGGEKLGNSLLGSQIDGLFQFKEDSVNDILGLSDGKLQKYNSATENWDVVPGETFSP